MNRLLVLLAFAAVPAVAADPPVSGDAVIRGKAGDGEIVVTTTSRVAGAVHSLTWNGKEFVDSFDHGRQIQSAANFDCGQRFIPEVFNPTEAGSLADGTGPSSSSRLLKLDAKGNELASRNRMAFWLKPGEKSAGNPARNGTVLSDHVVSKRVRVGYKGWPHAIPYDVTFTVPAGERHTFAQFEAVTGYMPREFSAFWRFDRGTDKLAPLADGPGEQADPVVLSTADGEFAMGVFSPDQPSKGYETAGYGRFRFAAEKVTKWNCVFRVKNPDGVPAGDYSFRTFLVVGTRSDCERTLAGLVREFARK